MSRLLKSMLALFALLSALSGSIPALAAEETGEQLAMRHSRMQYEAEIAHIQSDIVAQRVTGKLQEAQLARLVAEDSHAIFVLWAQAIFGIVLTVFVLFVVLAGVYLSYLQFKASVGPGEARLPLEGSRFVLSKEGFELSSSVIGLFVLLASMFFFYFYVMEVYPIRMLASEAAPPSAAAPPVPEGENATTESQSKE